MPTFTQSYIYDIVNSLFALGEVYTDAKIVQKILRSLLERFHAKVTTIEENKDLDSMTVEELVRCLTTLEMKSKHKGNETGIALIAHADFNLVSESDVSEDQMALLTQNFQKFLRDNVQGKKLHEVWESSMK